MSDEQTPSEKEGYNRKFPKETLRITTGCQYCAVGCGYNTFLVPAPWTPDPQDKITEGVLHFISPAMTNTVTLRGKKYRAAVVPDVRCDLNKGNHSVRGGSQGENLVSTKRDSRTTRDRLKSPMVRLADGTLAEITWDAINEVMARLVVKATGMEKREGKIKVHHPERLGVKIYEYQYLENTYAATKLFYSAIGTPNVAYHDRPSAAGSSPGLADVGFRPHDFSYDDARHADVLVFIGTNPYENQSVFFMQYCVGKEIIVIDPRKTATAQYAEKTGGLHVQPKQLGADPLVIYAIAREIIRRWIQDGNELKDFPVRKGTARTTESDADGELPLAIKNLKDKANNEDKEKQQNAKKRRASRAMTFDQFAIDFLKVNNPDSTYTLNNAARTAGINPSELVALVSRIWDERIFPEPPEPPSTPDTDYEPTLSDPRRPRVGILYEKGLIWGFNYHNTASVGSLGLLLGAYDKEKRGQFVGRVGGHQKGWAESKADLKNCFDNTNSHNSAYTEGYPFRNVTDKYSDQHLTECFGEAPEIKVHHNIDNHVFGPPPDFHHWDQSNVPEGSVRLKNNLVSNCEPDVRLLWIIGNNYLGQTNDGHRKRAVLERRLQVSGTINGVRRPRTADVDEIVTTLGARIEAGGLVCVHQELFANPTTEFCDIVIPAAGWGEDTFCRYNAQRRLKLYDRFQDMPLHQKDYESSEIRLDKDALDHKDPMKLLDHRLKRDRLKEFREQQGKPKQLRIERLQHSPRPDWLIIRDVAWWIGRCLDGMPVDKPGSFEKKCIEAFSWVNSSELSDEMALLSHRGLAGTNAKGQSLLGDLLLFGEKKLDRDETILHKLLGKEDADAQAPHLTFPDYSIPNESKVYPDESKVYGNAIATNGVMLPIRGVRETDEQVDIPVLNDDGTLNDAAIDDRRNEIEKIHGTLRIDRGSKSEAEPTFFFIKAPWEEIQPFFEQANHNSGHADEVFLTNGRVNHLWNNMFHHLRNDYVNERYPENLPGTILEVNSEWARCRRIENGQVVRVGDGAAGFLAIVSLQDWVADDSAFAMFSYPVRDSNNRFTFDGYVNNVTDGYADGINPIAALKYARAVIRKEGNPFDGSDRWIYPEHFRGRVPRQGPSFEQRNRLRPDRGRETSWRLKQRITWEMREVMVRKGLPRARLHANINFDEHFLSPDRFIDILKNEEVDVVERFVTFTSPEDGTMFWPINGSEPRWDEWILIERLITRYFLDQVVKK